MVAWSSVFAVPFLWSGRRVGPADVLQVATVADRERPGRQPVLRVEKGEAAVNRREKQELEKWRAWIGRAKRRLEELVPYEARCDDCEREAFALRHKLSQVEAEIAVKEGVQP